MLFQEMNGDCGSLRKIGRKIERKICSRFRFRNLPFVVWGEGSRRFSGKASLCAFVSKMKRASLAVETAFVLPLFLFGMITMISFMDVYRIQTEHLQNLCTKAKEAGMYAYVGGESGPEEIVLPDVYAYTPVGGWFPLSKVWMHNTVKVHAWTGTTGAFETVEGDAEPMVYMTATGTVYHTNPGCHYLNLSIDTASGSQVGSLRNSYGEKYSACETCSEGESPNGVVFITTTGNRYHNNENCSGLKRTVRLVKESETGGMHACSKCG